MERFMLPTDRSRVRNNNTENRFNSCLKPTIVAKRPYFTLFEGYGNLSIRNFRRVFTVFICARFYTTTNGRARLGDFGITTTKELLSTSQPPVGEVREIRFNYEEISGNVPASEEMPCSTLFQQAASADSLIIAWTQLTRKSGIIKHAAPNNTLNGINESWFHKASELLMSGQYKYPLKRKIYTNKPGKSKTRSPTIHEEKSKIIEKAILNAIEPKFEGLWEWRKITEQEWISLYASIDKEGHTLKRNKNGCFKKFWLTPTQFDKCSFGFRPNRSVNDAIRFIKSWSKDTVWFIDYDITKVFNKVNRARLKNIFLANCPEPRIWLEIQKMINAGSLDVNLIFEGKGVPSGSILSPFLFNVYMNYFDRFMARLKKDKNIGLNRRGDKRNNNPIHKEYSNITPRSKSD